jgi:hypothetical protein
MRIVNRATALLAPLSSADEGHNEMIDIEGERRCLHS